jgi:hypothetical protein
MCDAVKGGRENPKALEPGLYWAWETVAARPSEGHRAKQPRIVKVSGNPPWLRMERIYPPQIGPYLEVGCFEIIKPCCLDE